MNQVDNLIAAFEHRQFSGFVPRWELEFQLWDVFSGRHLLLGREFERLSAIEQERAMYANAEIILAVAPALGFSAVTGPNNYWEHAPGELAYYVMPGETRFRQMEILRELVADEFMLIGGSGGILGACYDSEYCIKLFEEPEEIDALAQRTLRNGIEQAKRYRDLGVGAVVSASDMADNAGPFYNPAQMQRFVLPYMRAWSEACHAMGLYTILHSDGQLTPYLDMIASTGIDALQAIDPVAGMDMSVSQQRVGDRLCLCGNVDCGLLVQGTPEAIYQATRDLLVQCKAGGSLVLGASNALQPDIPRENYQAVHQAWLEYGNS